MEEEKEIIPITPPSEKNGITKKIRENPWMLSTIVFGLLVTVLLVSTFTGGITGNVTKEKAAGNLITYLNTVADSPVTLSDVKDAGDMYLATVGFKGQNLSVYVTKDGSYYTTNLLPLSLNNNPSNSNTQQEEVPKTDKPIVELYVFSYCPAGTVALDSFAKMGGLLKNVADISVKFFSDMHGEHEKQQNMIQECIQDLAKDKYWDYANQYVSKIYNKCGATRDIQCDKTESINLMKSIGIDSDAVMNCVASKGEELYQQDKEDADALSLQYSPSVVINGVYLSNADRTSEGLKTAVCSAFNTAPAECSQTLSSSTASSSGSCN